MGANAALRGTFTVDVNADCYDDGSAVNSGYCVVSRRSGGLSKRMAVATQAGLAEMSAIAGLSAIEMYAPVPGSEKRALPQNANSGAPQAPLYRHTGVQRPRIPHAPSGEEGA